MEAIRRRTVRVLLVACGLTTLWVVTLAAQLVPAEGGQTVYDKRQNVTWLANGNYAAKVKYGVKGINSDGSMSYDAAVEWVDSLNRANYLGHKNWTIPATPKRDTTCSRKAGPQGNAFGFHCTNSTLGSLYYYGLGLREPQTAVPMPPTAGKLFKNFQPYLYWAAPLSGHEGAGDSLNVNGYISFSFSSGYKGSNVVPNYLYILPMFKKKAIGPVPAGELVYDSAQDVTWLANANLAATFRFDFDTIYINRDGAMDHATAVQFVNAMNGYNGGKGYLGQRKWELPPADTIDATCTATHNPKSIVKQSFGFNCTGSPLGKLYYGLLKMRAGEAVVETPDVVVGPFHNIQPYLYWSCLGDVPGRMTCGKQPAAKHFQFSFSFGNGFQGTDYLQNDMYVMVYYPGPPTP